MSAQPLVIDKKPRIGSAGRAFASQNSIPRLAPLLMQSEWNSYCLVCASWRFGAIDTHCRKCMSPIFRWVHDEELHHFRTFSSIYG